MRESFAIRVYKQYFNFGSAHFLIFADGSRERLHGHNYQVQVRLEGALAPGDIVVDFIPFKPLVKRLCDALDHCTLLPRDNPHLEVTEFDDRVEARHGDGSLFVFPRGDVLVLPLPNTSTEMLARHIAHGILAELPRQVPEARTHALEVQVEESGGQSGICRIELPIPRRLKAVGDTLHARTPRPLGPSWAEDDRAKPAPTLSARQLSRWRLYHYGGGHPSHSRVAGPCA